MPSLPTISKYIPVIGYIQSLAREEGLVVFREEEEEE
jgi:hypothetical protein